MKCVHFYITWDNAHPYGCRAFGFKGRVMPAITVKANSREECTLFSLKEAKPPEGPSPSK